MGYLQKVFSPKATRPEAPSCVNGHLAQLAEPLHGQLCQCKTYANFSAACEQYARELITIARVNDLQTAEVEFVMSAVRHSTASGTPFSTKQQTHTVDRDMWTSTTSNQKSYPPATNRTCITIE